MSDIVDDITLQLAIKGSQDAQSRLLKGMQDVWFRVAMSMTRNEQLAIEVSQETAFRVLKHLPGFDRRSTFKTWSIGILMNVVRQQRRVRPMISSDNFDQEDDIANPPESAILAEQVGSLRQAIDQLPPRQREAVVLRFFEDLSIDEVAKAMNAASGTVKATLFAALRALKVRLIPEAGRCNESKSAGSVAIETKVSRNLQ